MMTLKSTAFFWESQLCRCTEKADFEAVHGKRLGLLRFDEGGCPRCLYHPSQELQGLMIL